MATSSSQTNIKPPKALSSSSVSTAIKFKDHKSIPVTIPDYMLVPRRKTSLKRKRAHGSVEAWQKTYSTVAQPHLMSPLERGLGGFHVDGSTGESSLPLKYDMMVETLAASGVSPPAESFQRSTSQIPTARSVQYVHVQAGSDCYALSQHPASDRLSTGTHGNDWARQDHLQPQKDVYNPIDAQQVMWYQGEQDREWQHVLNDTTFNSTFERIQPAQIDPNADTLYAHSTFNQSTSAQSQTDTDRMHDPSGSMMHTWPDETFTNAHHYINPKMSRLDSSVHNSQMGFQQRSSQCTQATLSSPDEFSYCDGSVPCAEVDPHCELPCDQECKDEGCCDESQICCEPCPDSERCASAECDDASCLETPDPSVCVGKPACCSSRSSPVPFEEGYVDPKALILPCQWQSGDGSICDVSLHSREELSSHVHEYHIQPQGQISCQWDHCMGMFPIDTFEDHILESHLNGVNQAIDSCLWDGCGVSFESKNHLGDHLPVKPTASTFNCHWDDCKEVTVGERALKEHVDTDHIVEAIASGIDSRSSTADVQDLEASLEGLSADDKEASRAYIQKVLKMCPRVPRPGQYKCEWTLSEGHICSQTFTDANDLQKHVDTIHMYDFRQNKGLDLICQWKGCTRQFKFNERSKLARHLYTHTHFTMSTCCFCDHDFNNQTQLVNQIRGHLKHTHFSCSECSYVTTNKAALKTHERTHTQAKPLKCEICDYCCGDPSNMSKHRNTHREPRHKCPNCGKAFCRPGTMKRHLGTCGKSADEKARRKVGGVRKALEKR